MFGRNATALRIVVKRGEAGVVLVNNAGQRIGLIGVAGIGGFVINILPNFAVRIGDRRQQATARIVGIGIYAAASVGQANNALRNVVAETECLAKIIIDIKQQPRRQGQNRVSKRLPLRIENEW